MDEENFEELTSSKDKIVSQFNELDFCSGLFGCLKISGVNEFSISSLEQFIQLKLYESQAMFLDIDGRIVIQEGLSFFEILGGIRRNLYASIPKAKLIFSKTVAQELINAIPIEYSSIINQFAEEFQLLIKETNTKGVTKKLSILK